MDGCGVSAPAKELKANNLAAQIIKSISVIGEQMLGEEVRINSVGICITGVFFLSTASLSY